MKLRFGSDFHLDRMVDKKSVSAEALRKRLSVFEPLPGDSETVLILAGDLWEGTRSIHFGPDNFSWIGELSSRFKAVIVVLGNHDFWGETIPRFYEKYREALSPYPNVHLLESFMKWPSVVIDGVRFAGGTLFTNVGKGDPVAHSQFDFSIGSDGRKLYNDRNHIRVGNNHSRYSSLDMLTFHRQSLKNLGEDLRGKHEPVVWVSHMAPSLLSLPVYENSDPGDRSGCFYASDLSEFMFDHPQIRMAIHGHIHNSMDYVLGHCRVLCNPHGYIMEKNKKFQQDLVVEVDPSPVMDLTPLPAFSFSEIEP